MNNIKKAKGLGLLGIALCGLCCALPIISSIVGIASLTAIGVYLDKIGFVLLGLAIFFFGYGWYTKRKKAKATCANSCDSNCQCRTESASFN